MLPSIFCMIFFSIFGQFLTKGSLATVLSSADSIFDTVSDFSWFYIRLAVHLWHAENRFILS